MFVDSKIQKLFLWFAGVVILLGILFRFYHITESDFIFYDEGYYLNWSRPLGEILANHELKAGELAKAVYAYLSRSFASGKTLWFLLVDSRFFWGGLPDWSFSRILAAILGTGTLVLTYVFARRYFDNKTIALLAAALLAVLPSHVFYSRLGLQESLSTFLVLAGFYFYTFTTGLKARTFLAGLFFGAAYFSNYRLIMLPLLLTVWETGLAFSTGRALDVRKWVWTLVTFLGCVFGLGSLFNGENTFVIFSWVFHQASMAKEQMDWGNLFSYPYYLFRLDTFFFAVLFFANVYLIAKKEGRPLVLFALVLTQMAIFTLASEKGARYICIVLPFAAMAVSHLLTYLWTISKDKVLRFTILILTVVMMTMMIHKSFLLVASRSDYRSSTEFLLSHDPGVKILSTQNYIQNLYVKEATNVLAVPAGFMNLLSYYQQGYRYLVICPQAYVSMTEDKQHFSPRLRGYLEFLATDFKPQKVYPHFSPVLLERFVYEQNENLFRSIRFLNMAEKHDLGSLRVYDLSQIVPVMLRAVARTEGKGP